MSSYGNDFILYMKSHKKLFYSGTDGSFLTFLIASLTFRVFLYKLFRERLSILEHANHLEENFGEKTENMCL